MQQGRARWSRASRHHGREPERRAHDEAANGRDAKHPVKVDKVVCEPRPGRGRQHGHAAGQGARPLGGARPYEEVQARALARVVLPIGTTRRTLGMAATTRVQKA